MPGYWIIRLSGLTLILWLNIWLNYVIFVLLSSCFEFHHLRLHSNILKLLMKFVHYRSVFNNHFFHFFFFLNGVFRSWGWEHCRSTERWIHSQRRNRLDQTLVEKLVREHTHLVLRESLTHTVLSQILCCEMRVHD